MVPYKYSYLGYIISGNLGMQQAIPHARHCEQVINEIPGLSHVTKATGLKASLFGTALPYVKTAFELAPPALENTDNNVQGRPASSIC
jgi:hypothetical protein